MLNKDILLYVEQIDSPDANLLLGELSAALRSITGNGGEASFDTSDMADARARFVVARDSASHSLGCGAIRPLSEDTAELKRMYARQSRAGVGSMLLLRLEQEATALGYRFIRLETRKINERAVSFYLRHGFKIIPNYGKYVGHEEAVCFEKAISSSTSESIK